MRLNNIKIFAAAAAIVAAAAAGALAPSVVFNQRSENRLKKSALKSSLLYPAGPNFCLGYFVG